MDFYFKFYRLKTSNEKHTIADRLKRFKHYLILGSPSLEHLIFIPFLPFLFLLEMGRTLMGKERIELEIYYLVSEWPSTFLIINANKISIALAMVGVGKFDILTQILKIHFHMHNFYTYICKEFLNI